MISAFHEACKSAAPMTVRKNEGAHTLVLPEFWLAYGYLLILATEMKMEAKAIKGAQNEQSQMDIGF